MGHQRAVRAALRVELNDSWTITPSVMGQRQYADGVFGYDATLGELHRRCGHRELALQHTRRALAGALVLTALLATAMVLMNYSESAVTGFTAVETNFISG